MKRFLVFVALAFLVALAIAQEYKVTVTTVSIWVKALDDSDRAVQGLSESDFQVYEDGKPMTLTCFEETQISAAAALETQPESQPAPGVPKILPQRFVLYLDLLNTSEPEFALLKPKAQEFLDQISGKNWEVMVAVLTREGKLGVVVPFTKQIDSVRAVLDKAHGNPDRDRRNRQAELDIASALTPYLDSSLEDGLRLAYRVARLYANQENEISKFSLAALESFGVYLTKIMSQDHATIILISGGFSADPGREYYDMIHRIAERAGLTLDEGTYALTIPESKREFKFDFRQEIEKSIGKLNRSNITLYSINTRGPYVPGVSASTLNPIFSTNQLAALQDFQDSLNQVARETGGLSFLNTQNLGKGFDRILSDMDHQYTLCYKAPEHKKSGEFHRIKVECKKPGVKLRYRLGYVD